MKPKGAPGRPSQAIGAERMAIATFRRDALRMGAYGPWYRAGRDLANVERSASSNGHLGDVASATCAFGASAYPAPMVALAAHQKPGVPERIEPSLPRGGMNPHHV